VVLASSRSPPPKRYDRPDATPGPAKLLDGGLVIFASGRHFPGREIRAAYGNVGAN
jgi:hypothetical protein